jgi:hypothetical protein
LLLKLLSRETAAVAASLLPFKISSSAVADGFFLLVFCSEEGHGKLDDESFGLMKNAEVSVMLFQTFSCHTCPFSQTGIQHVC